MSAAEGVVYSIGARLGGGGIGSTALHAVRGLHRHALLGQALCGSHVPLEIPSSRIVSMGGASRLLRRLAVYDASGRVTQAHAVLYDRWSMARLPPCGVFHGWNNHCLRTLRLAKRRGAIGLVERASSHPLHHRALMEEEHRSWGLRFPVTEAVMERSMEELADADYVVVPSRFVRDGFLEHGFPRDRLIEIPFGVDVERFRPPVETAVRPFRLLFVGQVGLRKGLLYLLEAWKRLSWPDAELWVVGRERTELRPLFRDYRGLRGVRWMGPVADPARLYRETDVFAFPTLEEGSALVTYEALASGLPVVTTEAAGSVVRDGVEGFLVPTRSADALRDRLERLRSDASLRRAMSGAARERALAHTWRAYGDELAKAVGSLLP